MFSTLKKFFGPRGADAADPRNQNRPMVVVPSAPANPQRAVRADGQPRPIVPQANTPNSIAVPLRAVLDRLPPELAQRLRQVEVGDAHITLPMQKVLSQISQGSVKISFGELRQASPPGTFTPENDRDRSLVEIPLHEILSRLNPALLSRRPVQRQVSVPAEVTGPFSGQAQVMFTTAPLKPTAVTAPPSPPAPVPLAPPASVAPVAPAVPISAVAPVLAAPPVLTPPPLRPVPVQAFPLPPATPRVQPPQSPAPFAYPKPVLAQAVPAMPLPPVLAPAPLPVVQPMISRAQPVAPSPAPVSMAMPAMPLTPPPVAIPRPTPAPVAQLDTEQVFFRKASPIAPPPVAPPVVQPVYSPIAPDPLPEPVVQAPYIPVPELPRVAVALAPVVPITPIAPEAEQEPALIRFSMPPPAPEPITIPGAVPAPLAAPVMVSAPYIMPVAPVETRFLSVPVAELYLNWPEPVQQEIALHQLGGSSVALPFGMIEVAIRQGRVAAPWSTVRSWIQPPVATAESPLDATVLELPLRILTPLFLAELRTTKAQKRVVLDANIPDLFSNAVGAPVSAPAPAPARPAPITANIPAVLVAAAPPSAPVQRMQAPTVPKLADTNYFARKGAAANVETPEEAAPPLKKGPSPGTAFLIRYATPNEIISKAAALDGVDGALIALPDGLLVASHIPPTMNADTVAAFLPQIFGRVSQCTKELRLGDLNNLNFTVGNIPWKIFKVGAIYFAAFGRAGEPLPTAQLAGIAAELDRKAK